MVTAQPAFSVQFSWTRIEAPEGCQQVAIKKNVIILITCLTGRIQVYTLAYVMSSTSRLIYKNNAFRLICPAEVGFAGFCGFVP